MVDCVIKKHRGTPTLFYNNKPMPALVFEGPYKYVKNFAKKKTNVHIYSFITDLGWKEPNKYDYRKTDEKILGIVKVDSQALIIPQVDCNSPNWWNKMHPDELTIYDDGSTDINAKASYASKLWKKETGAALKNYVKHIRKSNYSKHIIGFDICVGYTGEWNKWKAQNGHTWDYSKPMLEAFSIWVRKKYQDNINLLRKNWNDKEVDFLTISIPTLEEDKYTDLFTFRDPNLSKKIIDYYHFRADLVAEDINFLCKAVRNSDPEKSIIGVAYGYVSDEFPGALFADEGFSDYERAIIQNWSHQSVSKILESRFVDYLRGFYPDYNRQAGEDAAPFSPIESFKLHDKLYINQDDTRTFLSINQKLGKSEDLKESINVIKRHFCDTLIRGSGNIWGNQGPGSWWPANDIEWYNHPELLKVIDSIWNISNQSLNVDRSFRGGIAIIVDEDSTCYQGISANLNHALFHYQKQLELGRIGTPYSIYLLNDLNNPNMPDYKFYIFINTFQLSEEEREIINRKVKKNNNIVIWVYAPGLLDESKISNVNMKNITGINLKTDKDNWGLRVTITNFEHPITGNLQSNTRFGTDYKIGPIIYSNDPEAITLGRLVYSRGMAKPGFTIKEFENWTSIFIGAPIIPATVLRNIAKYAGVHIYNDSLDVLYANNSFLCIHSNHKSGIRKIVLPKRANNIFDCFDKKIIAKHVNSFTLNLPKCTTKLFYIGEKNLNL